MADVKAVTRIEAILNGEDITPVTREEAILSGADVEPLSREEYFVQKRLAGGGGGGLEYVIPEQTVTFTDASGATLSNVDLSILEDNDVVIMHLENNVGGLGHINTYIKGIYSSENINFESGNISGTIEENKIYLEDDGNYLLGTYTISAIRGF